MTTTEADPLATARRTGPDITIRTGSGRGRTRLSAFDHALLTAGVAGFNLVTLSSMIPPQSRVTVVEEPLPGAHGDRLYCVLATAYADRPGETAWAGLGWTFDAASGGMFVEHAASGEAALLEQIELSLTDMAHHRGLPPGRVRTAVASAQCVDRPVCALAVAAFEVVPWGPGA
jgi:arginine decarboxylase